MNIAVSVYLVLFLYPFVALLVPEPNWLVWWWRTGGSPMPPELMERSKRNEGNLLLIKFILLILASYFFARVVLISFSSLGFRKVQPNGLLLVGVLAGALLVGWVSAMRSAAAKIVKHSNHLQEFLLRESTLRVLLINVLGGFAEEFWRALALTTLDKAGVSIGYEIFFTSVFFGVGHVTSYRSLGYVIGKLLAPTIGGIFLAILFLWTHTLFAPFVVHILLNSGASLVGRRRALAMQAPKGDMP